MTERENDVEFCACCGTTLTPDNCREVAEEFSRTGISPYCIGCEQEYYNRLAETEGKSFALFHACAAFNVLCKPLALEGIDLDKEENPWIAYIDSLAEQGYDRKDNRPATFFDGETNILRIFGKEMTEKDFAKAVMYERKVLDSQPGTAEQRRVWGKGFTAEEYDVLDQLYERRASSYKGQTIEGQMEQTLRDVCKWSLRRDGYISKNNVKAAKDMMDIIDKALANEQLRKKDEKPTEQMRMDALTVAMENAGLMKDGKFLDLDKTIDVVINRFAKRKKYRYSIDVLDQALLSMWNSARKNADLTIAYELPSEMNIEDENGEFEEEETEEEIKRKKYANLTPVRFAKDDGSTGERKDDKRQQ